MALLAAFSLSALHILYTLALFVYSGWKKCTRASPYPLETAQRRIPKHIAIILVTDPGSPREALEKTVMDTVVKAVGWCRIVGTQKLTVYEEHGMEHYSRTTR
jgi:dehydrodolichyl diphosphate syntase complex subunit NUS1